MIILINKKRAVLKKGSSFEFISENRFFTGADSYTLTITFPLRGCTENIDIFGHICRKDADLDTLLLDCEIHDGNFHRYGSVSIVSVSETEVKTQFLEGRSASNFHSSLDDIYINEIPMPYLMAFAERGTGYYLASYQEQKRMEANGEARYLGFVCLPWVNNTSGNIQNELVASDWNYYYKGGSEIPLIGFPFLIEVIRQVLEGAGYRCDLSEIEESQWVNLIVCQGFPWIWNMSAMNKMLPHWTVSEFLEQVELFLGGQFEIEGHNVRFSFNVNIIGDMQVVPITSVTDSHTVEIADGGEGRDGYIEQKNLAYRDENHPMWKFYSCQWAKDSLPTVSYESIAAMKASLDAYLDCAGPYRSDVYRQLHYCEKEDTCFVLKCKGTKKIDGVIHHLMRYQPVNMLGPRLFSRDKDADSVELGIVPACIDYTDTIHGDMLFVECGTLGDDVQNAADGDENQTQAVNTLAAGEGQQKEEFFDRIHVAFWEWSYFQYYPYSPRPYIDRHEIRPDNFYMSHSCSMRLTGKEAPFSAATRYKVNEQRRYTFSFLSDSIPDVRSIFLIHGKRYMAEKIKATFSAETGMSQLLKMTCYRLEDGLPDE